MRYKNKIKCKKCGNIIESKSIHDFVKCKCGSVFTDGGLEYQRVGWPEGNMEDWIEIIEEPIKEVEN